MRRFTNQEKTSKASLSKGPPGRLKFPGVHSGFFLFPPSRVRFSHSRITNHNCVLSWNAELNHVVYWPAESLLHSTKFKRRYLQKLAYHNASCPRTCPKNLRAVVPASPRSMDELEESAFRTRMQLFLLIPALQSGSKTYKSASFRLRWSFYLVRTNVGIPGTLGVRGRRLGIAIAFCAVVQKLRCVLLIA